MEFLHSIKDVISNASLVKIGIGLVFATIAGMFKYIRDVAKDHFEFKALVPQKYATKDDLKEIKKDLNDIVREHKTDILREMNSQHSYLIRLLEKNNGQK